MYRVTRCKAVLYLSCAARWRTGEDARFFTWREDDKTFCGRGGAVGDRFGLRLSLRMEASVDIAFEEVKCRWRCPGVLDYYFQIK